MGQFSLVDFYLDSFRHSVRWRSDSDDLVAEVADHLLISVERSVALGADPVEAQTASLDRFGQPDLVSRAFASTSNGGVALPTEFTKRAGLLGMISSGLMLLMLLPSRCRSIRCWPSIAESPGTWLSDRSSHCGR